MRPNKPGLRPGPLTACLRHCPPTSPVCIHPPASILLCVLYIPSPTPKRCILRLIPALMSASYVCLLMKHNSWNAALPLRFAMHAGCARCAAVIYAHSRQRK